MQTDTISRLRTSLDWSFDEGDIPEFPPLEIPDLPPIVVPPGFDEPLVIPDLPPLIVPDPLPLIIPAPEPLPVVEPWRSFQAADLALWAGGLSGDLLAAASTAIRRDVSAKPSPSIPDPLREQVEALIPTRAQRDEVRRRFPVIAPTVRPTAQEGGAL